MRPGSYVFILIAAFFLSACSHLIKKTPDVVTDPEVQNLIRTIKNQNIDLKTFKGIGKIRLWNKGKIYLSERIAWIGSEPLKFRIEVLFSGQPLIKVASDGKRIYYRNEQSHDYPYGQISLTEDNLERILFIPINPSDFMALLSGRIPLHKHDFATIEKNLIGEGYVVNLEERWHGVVEKIYLDQLKMSVQQIEVFDRSGSLIYRATFDRIKKIENYQIPGRLVVSTETGDRFQLDISDFQTGVIITQSIFVLTPPK